MFSIDSIMLSQNLIILVSGKGGSLTGSSVILAAPLIIACTVAVASLGTCPMSVGLTPHSVLLIIFNLTLRFRGTLEGCLGGVSDEFSYTNTKRYKNMLWSRMD